MEMQAADTRFEQSYCAANAGIGLTIQGSLNDDTLVSFVAALLEKFAMRL